MDSSYPRTLSQLFKLLSQWYVTSGDSLMLPWTLDHLSIVYGYILLVGSINSDFKLLSFAKKLPFSESSYPSFQFSLEMAASFIQELQELFTVPKFHQLYSKDKENELLAAFIGFLLKLLYHKIHLVHSSDDRIEDLKKELRFLVTFLGDTSLRGDELEEVKNLLAKFEEVANEAGRLVYSFIFDMDGVYLATRMDEDLDGLFYHINHLIDNITKFCYMLPCISKSIEVPKIATVGSLSIVESLLSDLEDIMNWEDDRIVDVKDQIKILHQGIMFSQTLLEDIKVPQHSQIQELEKTVMQIRAAAYEAEHPINSFYVGDARLWYLTIRLPHVLDMIKLVGTQLQEIKKLYGIGALSVEKNFGAQPPSQAERNYSEVDDVVVVGFEDEATHILDQLVGGTKYLQIISIFGMPGLGKTTLAKKLYNHPLVNYYFDKCSFCVVSQTYRRRNLLIDIQGNLGNELEEVKILDIEEEHLGERIYKSLKGRRYLLVMDDVWDSNAWDDLRRYFPDDGTGSRILLTSRNKDVAPPNSIICGLPSLSNDQCWELLQKKVFHNKPCPPQLKQIGKEIAENCYGLPLAVVVIAGTLSTMDTEKGTWEKVGRSLASYIFSDKNNSTMQTLKLSYKHLPEHLKPCFLYFGAFPEDAEISAKKLKYLWIAEGFIRKEKTLKTAESVAEEYLMELIDRSLVTVAKRRSDGAAKACAVHDLLRDLCLRIAEEENFLKLMEDNSTIHMKHRRLCFHKKPAENMTSHELSLPFGLHVRSLFGSCLDSSTFNFLNKKLLRVLDSPSNELIHGNGVSDSTSHRIEHVIHLRYLAVNYIPAKIDIFVNLEFLILNEVKIEYSVFSIIEKMVKLKYLRIPHAKLGKHHNSSRTNNLEYLSMVQIQKQEDEDMLKYSPHLRNLKFNCKTFVDEWGAYRFPDLRFLTQLESLKIFHPIHTVRSWGSYSHVRAPAINFPSNIKKLVLNGLQLPWEKMSIIGVLPSLQVLKLCYDAFEGERWDTRDGEFQQLRFLKLVHISITQWNVASSEHFPRLQRLVLWHCHHLQAIPCEIGEIAALQLIEVQLGRKSVAESAIKIQQEQREMGNEELIVIIRRTL